MKRLLRILGYLAGAAVASAAVENSFTNLQQLGASNELGASATLTLQTGSTLTAASGSTVTLTNGTVNYPVGQITDTATSLYNKPSVRAAADANVASLSGTTTIDGVALIAGEAVLLTAQSTASQNGPWLVQASTWTRPTWYPTGGTTQAISGSTFFIRGGTNYSGSLWYISTSGAITIGTTATAITQIKLTLSSASVQGTLPAAVLPVGGVTDTLASLANKPAVKVVEIANVASRSGTTTIDSVALVAGDTVLLTGQSTPSQNGPWVIAAGAWTRPTWYPGAGTSQAFYGTQFSAILGTLRAGSVWYIATTGAITIDSTSVTYTQRGAPASGVVAGSAGDTTHTPVITVNAAGLVTSLSSATIAGGGGGSYFVLLETHTASASATLDFTTAITSTYDEYVIEIINLVNATNGVDLFLRVSTDGGATYSVTGYEYIAVDNSTSNISGTLNSTGATGVLLFTGIDNAQSFGTSGRITLYDPLNASLKKSMTYHVSSVLQSVARRYTIVGSGFWGTTTAVNAVRFLYSSGNITSGTIRIYGVAH